MEYQYNTSSKYEIIGRILDGTVVKFYVFKDRETNSILKIEKAKAEQMALNKEIYNCRAQNYQNIVNMKGINCKISQMQKYNDDLTPVIETEKQLKKKVVKDLKLIGKILSGKQISDYVVININEPNVLLKVSKENVLLLAKEGRVINAKVQYYNGVLMLRGTDVEPLSALKQYR